MARTLAGRDWMARVMADTSSDGTGSYHPANWIALSSNGDAPSTANTTLPGELTGGTFARAQGAFAHTDGTASYTLIHTFTSDRNVTAQKAGIFTASSGGTLVFETLMDAAVLKPGDTVQFVHTVTL